MLTTFFTEPWLWEMFIKLNHLLRKRMVIGSRLLVVLFILLVLIPLVAAEGTATAKEADCLIYFYGKNCDECLTASQHLNFLKTRYPQLQIKELEVYYDRTNARTLDKYFNSYRVPENSRGVPALFIPGSYFIGSSTMVNLLESRIIDNQNEACPTVEGETAVGLVGKYEPYNVLNTLTVSTITKEAFKDAFRPGMLLFLLVLLMILSSFRKKENVLQRGILSVLMLALASLLFGLGLLFKAPPWIPKVGGILAILASIVRIKGFFKTWRIVFEGISQDMEEQMINYLRYLFTPVGVVIVSFTMAVLSTGKVSELLDLLRALALDGIFNFKLFGYLFYHTIIILILPALLVLIFCRVSEKLDQQAQAKEPYHDAKAEKWREHTQKVLRFTVSSLMLIIGFILLFS